MRPRNFAGLSLAIIFCSTSFSAKPSDKRAEIRTPFGEYAQTDLGNTFIAPNDRLPSVKGQATTLEAPKR